MKVWLDGDACPREVKEIVFRASERRRFPVTLVANKAQVIPRFTWITQVTVPGGMDVADAVLVVTRTGTDAKGRGALSLFIVDTAAPGLEFRPIPMEIKAPDHQFAVFFDDVAVPADRLIGGVPDQGMTQVFSGLNPERVNVAAQATGLGRYFLDKAVAYARQREVWRVPIGAHQGVAHPLAKAWAELEAANLMAFKAAALFDAGRECGAEANAAKYLGGAAGFKACEAAVLAHGGMGYAKAFDVERYFREAMIARIAPVSREMILNYIAERVLGLPKSY